MEHAEGNAEVAARRRLAYEPLDEASTMKLFGRIHSVLGQVTLVRSVW